MTSDTDNSRISVVTGGSSGIGAAVVAALTQGGHQCVVVDLKPPAVQSPGVSYLEVDLSRDDASESIQQGLLDLGISSVRDLVHCAAILHVGSIPETPRSIWEKVIQVNLCGTIAVAQGCLPLIEPGGRIVLFASGTVFKGPPDLFAYVASKAGVIGFARCLAEEVGSENITVNVVSPGLTNTPMLTKLSDRESGNIARRAIPRRQEPEDLIGCVRFLLSEDSAFMTGQTLSVDGGVAKL